MSKNTLKLKQDRKDDNYVPLFERVGSWWASETAYKAIDKDSPAYNKAEDIHTNPKNYSLSRWSDERVKILEILWGHGRRIPGDDAFNQELFKPSILNSKSKVLDIAVGLGNCSRMMAKSSYAHIDVVEAYPNLLPYLHKLTRESELEAFISVLEGDLSQVKLPSSKYDLVFGREALFKIKNKQNILEKCVDSLNSNGNIIFTDFVLEKDASSYGIFKNWAKRESAMVYPVSEGVYKKIFKGFDMTLFQSVDYSKQYINHINAGWVRLKNYLKFNEYDDAFVDIMVEESDLWLSRVRALESGKLKLLKFHAKF